MANMLSVVPVDPRWKSAAELSATGPHKRTRSLAIPCLKQLLSKGLNRGVLVEANGKRSSGKTALCLHILAQATERGEVCAVVDFDSNFHPDSAAAGGVQLDRLLWIRCQRNPEHTMRATDLLLQAGGFGVVLLDLNEATARVLNRIPLSYWYRFQRVIENSPTILLVCANSPQAKAASSYSFDCQTEAFSWSGKRPFTRLCGIRATAQQRKSPFVPPAVLRIMTEPDHGEP